MYYLVKFKINIKKAEENSIEKFGDSKGTSGKKAQGKYPLHITRLS